MNHRPAPSLRPLGRPLRALVGPVRGALATAHCRVVAACAAVLFLLCPAAAAAQPADGVWTLSDCIAYAIDHNVALQQQALGVESAELQLQTSRLSRLPDLNASVGQGFGFGRSTDRIGQTVDRTSASTSFGVSTSVPLFTGFRIPNQVRADEFSLRAATAQLEQARQDLSIAVTTYYLNALYYRGLAAIARSQLELDRAQLRVADDLVAAGKRPASERATAQAQVAAAELALTRAEGDELLARLDLLQQLNLDDRQAPFTLAEPDTTSVAGDIPLPDAVFAMAAELHPAVLASRYQLEAQRRQLGVARSAYFPQLSLSASYSNSYYHTYRQQNLPLADQLDLNGSEYIGLSLHIPLFNRFSTRNSVRQARLRIRSGEADLVRARQTLQKEIEQAYWNALTARRNHDAARQSAAAAALAHDYEAERYAVGKATATDLQAARQALLKAGQEALQARYDYLMRLKILEFYNGVPLQ